MTLAESQTAACVVAYHETGGPVGGPARSLLKSRSLVLSRRASGEQLVRRVLAYLGQTSVALTRVCPMCSSREHGALSAGPYSVSVSHAEGLTAAAVAPADASVGIDVEALARERLPLPSATHHVGEPDSPRRALRDWTAREAVSKAVGMGMTVPLSAIRFSTVGLDGTVSAVHPAAPKSLEVVLVPLPPGFVGSLARASGSATNLLILNSSDLPQFRPAHEGSS